MEDEVWTFALPLAAGAPPRSANGSMRLCELVDSLAAQPPSIPWKAMFFHAPTSGKWRTLADSPELWARIALKRAQSRGSTEVPPRGASRCDAERVWHWAAADGKGGEAATQALSAMLRRGELSWSIAVWTKDAGMAAWHGLFSDVLGMEMRPAVRDLLRAIAGIDGGARTAAAAAHGLLPLNERAINAAAAAALAGERAEARDNHDGVALALHEFRAASKARGSANESALLESGDGDDEEALLGDGPLWCYGEATLETNGARGTARESEIVAMLRRGALSPRARVWSVGRVDWVEAVSVPRFCSAIPSASPSLRLAALQDADARAAETRAAEPPRARRLFGVRDRARAFANSAGVATASTARTLEDRVAALDDVGELYFIYRYISRESCSQFDSLPLTSLTISLTTQRASTTSALSGSRTPGRSVRATAAAARRLA